MPSRSAVLDTSEPSRHTKVPPAIAASPSAADADAVLPAYRGVSTPQEGEPARRLRQVRLRRRRVVRAAIAR